MGLLTGKVRAQSLNLVGAEMSVRIETDGRVTVFAGADKRPIATAAAGACGSSARPAGRIQLPQGPLRAGVEDVAGSSAWIDGLGATGLDGHDLRELGLKNGNLIVDDRRNGKHWTFNRINVSLTRPAQGGVIFRPGVGQSRPALGVERRDAAARRWRARGRHRGAQVSDPRTFCWRMRLNEGPRRDLPLSGQRARRNLGRWHAATAAGPGARRLRAAIVDHDERKS